MKQLKRFTLDDIRKFGPCFDPVKYGKETEEYTILDVLNHPDVEVSDKLWLVLRTDFISERTMRLFAVWSYRQTLSFISNPDPRSIECANVVERFANGIATKEELSAAKAAADAAQSAAAYYATYYSAGAAAKAAEAAYNDAANAAYNAAKAAYNAAHYAAEAAYNAAHDAAYAATYYAAQAAQLEKLIQMVTDGIETGDTVLE